MTRMQRISRAPLLSATLSRDSCWIMRSPRLLDDLDDAPALVLRERSGLHDPHQVAHAAVVLVVVDLELRPVLHDLLVEGVGLEVGDLHHHRLVHLVGDHPAHPHLAKAALIPRLVAVGHSLSSLSGLRARRLFAGVSASVASTASGESTDSDSTASGSAASGSPVAAGAGEAAGEASLAPSSSSASGWSAATS